MNKMSGSRKESAEVEDPGSFLKRLAKAYPRPATHKALVMTSEGLSVGNASPPPTELEILRAIHPDRFCDPEQEDFAAQETDGVLFQDQGILEAERAMRKSVARQNRNQGNGNSKRKSRG